MPEQVLTEQASDGAAVAGGATLVAATDHVLAAQNFSRDRLIVTADTADVWVSLGAAAAVVGQGIRVKAAGPPYEITGWKGAVHCISSGAAVVGVTETSFQTGDDEGERPAGADAFVPSGPSDSQSQSQITGSQASGGKPGQAWPPQT